MKPCLKSVSTSRSRLGQLPGASSIATHDACGASCTPQGEWIHSITYISKSTPNAFYVGFEDGNSSATSFGNENSVRLSDAITTRVSG